MALSHFSEADPPFTFSPFKKMQSFPLIFHVLLSFISLIMSCLRPNNLRRRLGIPEHLTCLLRNLYEGKEATVRTGHETTAWFQIGKGVYIMAVYCHPAYLTYMQSTS